MVSITFLEFPEYVQISKAQRAKYVKWVDREKKKIAQKHYPIYEGTGKDKGFTMNKHDERVVLNPKVAGTPKFLKIAGNLFYEGQHPYIRKLCVDEVKDFFIEELTLQGYADHSISSFPLAIFMRIFVPEGQKNFDTDNFWFYQKVFPDCLTALGIIPDDNVNFIKTVGKTIEFVETIEERKLVFDIIKL